MPNHKVEPKDVVCRVCGTHFETGGRGRKPLRTVFCSKRCAAKARIKQAAIRPLSELDAAYCAGVFDGEGSVVLWDRGYGGRLQLRCTVANTYRPLMDWLQDTLGTGSVVEKKYTRQGQEHYLDAYTYQVYGQNAVEWLRAMLPYLIVKRDKALVAIESQSTPKGNGD